MELIGPAAIIILAGAGILFHIVLTAHAVAHGLSIYERKKRARRQEAKNRKAQRERQEKYNKEHPTGKGFYSGGVRYVD